jgi:hypothetical protein
MEELISQLKDRFSSAQFRNEQAIRETVVLPILQALGWKIWDPTSVVREYALGARRVDYALTSTPPQMQVFIEVKIRRAFIASGAEVLSSTQIYAWTHPRRRLGHRKTMPLGIYWRTLRTLRARCEPIARVPPHGAWTWRLRNTEGAKTSPLLPSASEK